jgi:hypothetical protein
VIPGGAGWLTDHPRRILLSAIGAETALMAEQRRALDTDLASDP